ncbi:FAD-dependent oxidoreductase [Bacillus pumilus]|uniref:FAD-dependent oxidoreductase n=1 Tax=Bacillus pumilus TaxID=1408 RepID=UPI0023D98C27|nr:FAD-dependent oxidoreductase [Bacillus pumilus]MDF2002164.1 FAD-dependent oxidoreductase [Bacillus pumilus]MDF2023419.1 FAD-dependent oxidoreductase [Bacillus pumilus]MDF2027046.1 FAD-dependent oxidoreductase [Bacillus pumilus]MDF2088229.1 FAD-dependent oxidoreductase [Bacillus pumilus]
MTQSMTYERAIVIGGGMTGMFAAKVLSTFYHQVFIIEKDELPDAPKNRLGTPQAFHPHRMLPLGKQIVERLFPGYTKELLAMDGFNTMHQTSRFITKDGELTLTDTEETAVTRRAMLEFKEGTNQVMGLIVKNRQVKRGSIHEMKADLVIDTSGRMSKLPKWLKDAGLTLPQTDELSVFLGYSTRYYQIPPGAPYMQSMVVVGQPHKQIPTGLFERVDHDLVAVLLSAAGGSHYPTTDDAQFDSETAALTTHPAIAEAITHLTPFTKPKGFRVPSCVRHHYEHMQDWPSGLLVMGDSMCTLDPIHGQGMTKAALEAQTLDRMLKQAQKNERLSFEKDTLQQMQHASELGWWLCAIADMAWDGVELKGETTIPHLTFVQEYLNRYVQYAIVTKQPECLEAYHRMHSFLTEPREIINLEQLHNMIQADTSGETTEWWKQWDQKNDEDNRAFFHEAVPDFRLEYLLSFD